MLLRIRSPPPLLSHWFKRINVARTSCFALRVVLCDTSWFLALDWQFVSRFLPFVVSSYQYFLIGFRAAESPYSHAFATFPDRFGDAKSSLVVDPVRVHALCVRVRAMGILEGRTNQAALQAKQRTTTPIRFCRIRGFTTKCCRSLFSCHSGSMTLNE